MLVKELKKKLGAFDDNMPIVVRNESLKIELPVQEVRWEFDNYCKIIIDGE